MIAAFALMACGAGNAATGQQLFATCVPCHGARAEGNASLFAPRLAGLDAAYLKRQYRHFRDGVRGAHPQDRYGRQMSVMAKVLPTDKDLEDVIAFIHTMGTAE
jgi:cytochrome c oxidase subunit 2